MNNNCKITQEEDKQVIKKTNICDTNFSLRKLRN